MRVFALDDGLTVTVEDEEEVAVEVTLEGVVPVFVIDDPSTNLNNEATKFWSLSASTSPMNCLTRDSATSTIASAGSANPHRAIRNAVYGAKNRLVELLLLVLSSDEEVEVEDDDEEDDDDDDDDDVMSPPTVEVKVAVELAPAPPAPLRPINRRIDNFRVRNSS